MCRNAALFLFPLSPKEWAELAKMTTMQKWSVDDSAEMYGVRNWGAGYFDISKKGEVVIRPFGREGGPEVSVPEIIRGIQERGYDMPVLLRIENILDSQISLLHQSFRAAISELGYKVIVTTDHGTIRVDNPIKVVGDRNTNTNLRYKCGKNLNYNPRQVYEMHNPRKFGLPAPNLSSTFIFALNEDFFSYPNNYNYYVQYYTGTFQHGGISIQEMLVPLVTLTPK